MKKFIENLLEKPTDGCYTQYSINGLIRIMKKHKKSVEEILKTKEYFEDLNEQERIEELRMKWLNEQYNTEII